MQKVWNTCKSVWVYLCVALCLFASLFRSSHLPQTPDQANNHLSLHHFMMNTVIFLFAYSLGLILFFRIYMYRIFPFSLPFCTRARLLRVCYLWYGFFITPFYALMPCVRSEEHTSELQSPDH